MVHKTLMDIDARALCHEAGHAVVGLHFGFRIDEIKIDDGRPKVEAHLDSPERTPKERYIFLTGGIAGEKRCDPTSDFDREASGRDQIMITDRAGGSIDEYLSEALDILRSHSKAFEELRRGLMTTWTAERLKAALEEKFGGRPRRSFQLLSQEKIAQIWAAHTH